MNNTDQNIAVAEFHGWEGVPVKNATRTHDGVAYWRSQTPDGLEKYSSCFEGSCAIRWLKKPDGSPFLIMSGPTTVNNVDTYSTAIALEYSKENGYGKPPPDAKPSLDYFYEYLPDYGSDLNAMHEVEKLLDKETNGWRTYAEELENVCKTDGWTIMGTLDKRNIIHATAAQRREALLRTIGKWRDS